MAAKSRLCDFLKGTSEDSTVDCQNSYKGRYSFTHHWTVSREPFTISERNFKIAVAPVNHNCNVVIAKYFEPDFNIDTFQICVFIEDNPLFLLSRQPISIECSIEVRMKRPHEKEPVTMYQTTTTKTTANPIVSFEFAKIPFEATNGLNMMHNGDPGYECHITTTLKLPALMFTRSFHSDFVYGTPDPFPETIDFRVVDFTDPSTHDYTFICTDGRTSARKDALFKCSTYFNKHFETEKGLVEREMNVDAPVAAVNLLLLYLLADCFKLNISDVTPNFARAIVELTNSHVPPYRRLAFYDVLHMCFTRRVIQMESNLDELVEWLAFAAKNKAENQGTSLYFTALYSAVITTIAQLHWNDYLLEYIYSEKELIGDKKKLAAELHHMRDWLTAHGRVLHHFRLRLPAVECE